MSTPLVVEGSVHFRRRGKGACKVLEAGPAPAGPEPGRVPRVARLMALAIRLDGQIRAGVFESYSQIAVLGDVTRARVSQVMSLLNLAPDLQEAILFLPRVESGRAPIVLRDLLPVAAVTDWARQRRLWRELLSAAGAPQQPETEK